MSDFTLDTSGVVYGQSPYWDGTCAFWSGLSPFAQGYVEALFASRVTRLSEPTGDHIEPLGVDFGFSDLSPEALAMILRDCEAFVATMHMRAGWFGSERHLGSAFWQERQMGAVADFPPYTVTLSDEGKVELREVQP